MTNFSKLPYLSKNNEENTNEIYYEKIIGSRRLSNYFWAITILLASIGFLIVGISSYMGFNIIPFLKSDEIVFFPQGIVMCFYGICGTLLSVYQWLVIIWNVGEGYNKFDKKNQRMKLFRWGFPGKNREINITYGLNEIRSIKVEIKEGLNPTRIIYVCLKSEKNIPLSMVRKFSTTKKIIYIYIYFKNYK